MSRDTVADLNTLHAIQAAARAGHHSQAAEMAEAALADGLEHPLLYNLAALRLEQEGRVSEAAPLLRRALEIAPADQGARNALGLCLLRLERPREALLEFEALLKLNPNLPFAHASRGAALFALGSIPDAEASYRRALEIDPNQVVALAGLANLASSRGAYPAAQMWAEKALSLLPEYPDAILSLAAAQLGQKEWQAAESRLRDLLSRTQLDPLQRAYAQGLLGDVLDAQDRTEEAYAAYSTSNHLQQEVYADRFGKQPGALAYVREMIRYFEDAPAAAWKSRVIPDERSTGATGHVFLLGFPRSGTTLLEVILEGHPNVVSLEENESLIDSVNEYMQRPQDLDRLLQAPPAVLKEFRAAYWSHVARAGLDVAGKMFVDKHPLNTLKLPLIARLFPDARILFACRDPRDIVLSCFRHRFRMSAPIYELLTLGGAAHYYDAVMRLMVRLSETLSLETCLVRHEDVVTGFAREMKRICDFLGLEWAPAMGDFALRTQNRPWLTPSTAQLMRGLSTEGLGQWRRYRSPMEPVLPVIDPWVKRFYYAD
jgi:tetratricopeptide (TPR) repeat protein